MTYTVTLLNDQGETFTENIAANTTYEAVEAAAQLFDARVIRCTPS